MTMVKEVVLRRERACVPGVGRFLIEVWGLRPEFDLYIDHSVLCQYQGMDERGAMIRDLGLDIVSVQE